MDWLDLACKRLQVSPSKILSHKIYDEHIAVVVDNGIAGAPKFSLSFAELTPYVDEESLDLPEEEWESLKASHYETFTFEQLKAAAKKAGIASYWKMRRETLLGKLTAQEW